MGRKKVIQRATKAAGSSKHTGTERCLRPAQAPGTDACRPIGAGFWHGE